MAIATVGVLPPARVEDMPELRSTPPPAEGLGEAGRTVRVLVLSDTHAPRFWKRMPEELSVALAGVDHVLHAGDVCEPGVLDELALHAPVTVVQGNNDGPGVRGWGAEDTTRVELAGVRIGMVHDSGPARHRAERMHGLFPDCDVVVFGHSHIPWHTRELVDGHAFVLLNPGSPTDPRRQPQGSFVLLDLSVSTITGVRFVPVPRGAGRLPTARAARKSS